ncbi:hypothetical protein [Clostridium hydrogenum]|nr:hypothetical protein [Clostridium hydrogenum]
MIICHVCGMFRQRTGTVGLGVASDAINQEELVSWIITHTDK